MFKFARPLALLVGIAVLVASAGVSTAPAGQKEKKAKEEVGTIEVYQAKDGWRLRVKNTEGKSIAIGTTGFKTKEDCLKVVETLKTTFAKGKVTEVKGEKDK